MTWEAEQTRNVYTHPTADRDQTRGCGDTVDGAHQIRDRLVAACTRYLGEDLDIEVLHPSQWKKTKRQRMWNRLMAVGTRHANFGPRAKTNLYLKRARKMGKSLITTST